MNDSTLTETPLEEGADAALAPGVSSPTAGQMLGNARRAAGLSLDELAARVKVPVKRLSALEEDRFEEWPDANLVRAVAASVCRQVRLDPAIILARMPKAEKKAWSTAVSDAPVGFRDRGGFTLRSPSGLARLPLALLALALALAAAGLYFAPALQAWVERVWARQPISAAAPAPAAVPEPVLPPDAEPTDTRVGATAPEAPASQTAAVRASAPATIASVAAPLVMPFKSSADASVAGKVASPPATAIPSPSPLLVFKARGLTWVAVTDAKGVSLLRKTLAAGETVSAGTANAALPLWVVVGRAENIEVEVRGQRLKLEPSEPENVAKFKVQ